MGHVRLGTLPDTRPWRTVVGHLADGATVAVVATATTRAAVRGLKRGADDPGVAHVVFLLARTCAAARAPDFRTELAALDLQLPAEPTLFDLTAAFAAAVQTWYAARPGCRTDLGEMAALAAAETLAQCVGDRAVGAFATGDEVRRALRDLSTANGFGALGHEFFARFVRRFLLYHLGRELSLHVGGHGRFADARAHAAFLDDLATHCRGAAVIVRDYVAAWYAKAKFEDGISPRRAAGFAAHALSKLRRELEHRGADRG